MSRRRRILLTLLAIVLLVPSTVLYLIATTERGLQFIVSRLGKMGSITITAGTVKGTLVDGFSVDSLRIQHRLADIRITNASGSVELLPLLVLQRITLPEVRVQNVSITMQRAPERPQRTPRFLPALLRIDADAVHIGAADITLLSGRIVPLRNIEGNASVLPKQIRIRQARADHELLHYEASGHVNAARPLGLDGDAEISWSIAGQPDWLIFTHFDGDLDKLPLTGRIQKPFHADIEGAATDLARGWKFAGHTKVRDFDLQKFGGGKALGIISGELDVAAAGEGFSAKGLLTPPGLKAGAFGVDFHGSYSQKVVTIQRTTITHAPSGARATVQGTATIVKGGPELDLAGSWTSFRWPLPAAEPAFASPRGNYTLGGVKPWSVQVDGDVIAAGQPEMPAKMRGLLAGDSLRIDDAEVQVLGGAAKFTGEVHWQPAESWRVAGRMTDLDAARLRPDLPGQLSFDFKASGAPFGATGSMDLEAQNLAGKLRGRNISGKGQFARAASSSDWKFRGVDVSLARTRLQLEGGFGVQSDLSFVIDSDDLSLFDPEARGRISARGRYAGTRETPQLQFKGRGTDFEWKGSKLAALDADVDMDLGVNGHARGQVDLSGLVIGSRTLQKASVQLTGTGQQQRLAVNVEAAPVRSTLVAQGGMQAGLWQGTLQALTIDDNLDLHLALEAPASLALNLQQQQLGQTCLKGAEERLCITGQRQPDGMWTANLAADSVPLHAFTAGLTQNTDYEGTLSLQAELAGHNADLPTGTFRGLLQKAELRHRLTNKRVETMSLGTGSITGNATTTGFAMQVNLDAGASGSIKGDLSGERNAGRWQDYPIKGSLDASSDAALPMLDIYVGGIDKATGRAVARIGITGTLGAPTLQGLLQLRDASIDIYQFNTLLRDLSVDATFNSNSLDIEGSSRLGKGTAKISGNLSWKDREPYGNLHVEGENLRVVDVPEARIDASPNLDFRIAGRSIDATGEVRIPYAQLNPADLTNVVLASSDARLKDATVIDPAQRWVVVSRITMTLGDEVNLNALGLRARLGGSIVVRTDESQNSRGQGSLNITEGKFDILGRQLDIERGRLIFDGPLSDPGIDLKAQKVFPDVTAGVNVRGLLRKPTMTFFSEPAIPRNQIESLLVAGGSLESAQNSNRSGAAREAAIAQGVALAAQRMGSRVGVDDVGLETDLSNDTSLVLGKYLSPRIYVSYGISIAEAINTLKMRFTISDRWTIKTESGKARSADIVFTIQK